MGWSEEYSYRWNQGVPFSDFICELNENELNILIEELLDFRNVNLEDFLGLISEDHSFLFNKDIVKKLKLNDSDFMYLISENEYVTTVLLCEELINMNSSMELVEVMNNCIFNDDDIYGELLENIKFIKHKIPILPKYEKENIGCDLMVDNKEKFELKTKEFVLLDNMSDFDKLIDNIIEQMKNLDLNDYYKQDYFGRKEIQDNYKEYIKRIDNLINTTYNISDSEIRKEKQLLSLKSVLENYKDMLRKIDYLQDYNDNEEYSE